MPPLGLDQPTDVPAVRLCPPGEQDPLWYERHRTFVAKAQKGGIDLYLEGDSLTDLWTTQFTTHYDKTFGRWKTGNFAISGDRTEHVLWRITNGELEGVTPKVIMLCIGTNNLPSLQGVYAAKLPAEVAAGVKAILAVFAEKQPQAKVLLIGPPPREDRIDAAPPARKEDLNPKVRELNALLAKMAGGKVKYLDFFEQYLENRKIRPGMLADKLHPAEPGYEIWAKAVTPTLTEWLG